MRCVSIISILFIIIKKGFSIISVKLISTRFYIYLICLYIKTVASAVSTLLVTSDGPDSMTLKWVQPDRYEYIVAYWISVVSSNEPCCPLYLKLKCTNRVSIIYLFIYLHVCQNQTMLM